MTITCGSGSNLQVEDDDQPTFGFADEIEDEPRTSEQQDGYLDVDAAPDE